MIRLKEKIFRHALKAAAHEPTSSRGGLIVVTFRSACHVQPYEEQAIQ